MRQACRLLLALVLQVVSGGSALAQVCNINIPESTPTAQFTDNGDGTVTDGTTGLVWKRCVEGQVWSGGTCTGTSAFYTWQQALQQAGAVNGAGGFAGRTDWRLPNIKELESIVEERCYIPAINTTAFPNTAGGFSYWSASANDYDWRNALSIDFAYGSLYYYAKGVSQQARLVRAGRRFGASSEGRGDVNGDGKADLIWRELSLGQGLSWWTMNGAAATGSNFHMVGAEWQIADVGDLDGDGKTDLVWRRTTDGAAYLWTLDGLGIKGFFELGIVSPAAWTLVGTVDLDGNGKADLVWRGSDGTIYGWLMNGGAIASQGVIVSPGAQWVVAGLTDMDGNGTADIVFRNVNDGGVYVYFMNGLAIGSGGYVGAVDPAAWTLAGVADFSGDGTGDFLWRHTSGDTWVWLMSGAAFQSAGGIGNPGAGWSVKSLADLDGDGKTDLVWRHTDGTTYLWTMNGTSVSGYLPVSNPGGTWQIVAP